MRSLPGSPVIAVTDTREHLTTFVIEVQQWSDGTKGQLETKSHVH